MPDRRLLIAIKDDDADALQAHDRPMQGGGCAFLHKPSDGDTLIPSPFRSGGMP